MNFTESLALVLINTQKEYLSGDTHRCLEAYFSNNASVDKKIDLHIFFNKGEESEYLDLLEYKKHKNVNNVIIKSHRLSDFDDLYARTPKELKEMNLPKVPPLGGSAGPNNLFFNSMIPLTEKSYRDYLMIEPDTQPIQDNWIDKIIQFCDDEKFLVAGSMYRGKATLYTFAHWSGHLNGVAIYRNGLMLKVLFKYAKALIEKETELTDNAFLSFDVAMHQLRCTLSGQKHFNKRNLPENHLLDCPIISNYSLPIDANTTIESVKKEHPQTIILHKK
jgi:hypothetical protein